MTYLKAFFSWFFDRERYSDFIFSALVFAACAALYVLPSGFENRVSTNSSHADGVVISADNSLVRTFGLVKSGSQTVQLSIQDGRYAGKTLEASNYLVGKMELDRLFKLGDRALVTITEVDGRITDVRASDYQRLTIEKVLLWTFALLLLIYGGFTGFKALLSFVFSALALWKLLFPSLLKGYDPIAVALLLTLALSIVIIYLVAGISRRGHVALAGTLMGLVLTWGIAELFGEPFRINGAVRPFAETLLYSGFPNLNLRRVFLASVFLASSGAVMDLSMDISTAMEEIRRHQPSLTRWQLLRSGLHVGRAVIGTMTTTLLLAYSGSTITMIMTFIAQGVPLPVILNNSHVSSEIFHTVAGSLGLVAVAPLTAFASALSLPRR
ncbi:MAG: YibE/F family protein [Pyramidobacter sp.]|nr:YibE/F family protein [Pyramidobacter sp.]